VVEHQEYAVRSTRGRIIDALPWYVMIDESRVGRASYLMDLARELVVRDMKLRYKRSILGIGWSLLNPLLQFLVFYGVFRWIIPVNVPDFAVFLLIGILAWSWFQSSLHFGCAVITDNASLIRQPGFPAAILPVIAVGTNLVNFVLALPVLAIALLVTGHSVTAAIVVLPFVIVIQFLLTLSAVYLLAVLQVPFRDTQYLVGVLLLLGLYVSPVFYSVQSVPVDWQRWFNLNPLAHILEAYRMVLIQGRYPDMWPLLWIAAISIMVLAATHRVFVRSSHWFIEEIGS
jgi:lipopolysaccharide transport system permease protein